MVMADSAADLEEVMRLAALDRLMRTNAFSDGLALIEYAMETRMPLSEWERLARQVAVERRSPVVGYRHLLIVAGIRRLRRSFERNEQRDGGDGGPNEGGSGNG